MSEFKNPQDAIDLMKIRNHMAAMISIKGTDFTLKTEEVNALLPLLEKAFEPDSAPDISHLFEALELWLNQDLPADLDILIKETLLSLDLNSAEEVRSLISMIGDFCGAPAPPAEAD